MKNICDVIFKLVLDATKNNMLMQHLLVDLKASSWKTTYNIGKITKWAYAPDISNKVSVIE